MTTLKDFLMTEAVGKAPSQLRSELVKTIKSLGLKQVGSESSKGAMKTWFDPNLSVFDTKKEEGQREFGKTLAKKLPGFGWRYSKGEYYSDSMVTGKGFEIVFQKDGSIFLAVYKKGEAGMEYELGIDS